MEVVSALDSLSRKPLREAQRSQRHAADRQNQGDRQRRGDRIDGSDEMNKENKPDNQMREQLNR